MVNGIFIEIEVNKKESRLKKTLDPDEKLDRIFRYLSIAWIRAKKNRTIDSIRGDICATKMVWQKWCREKSLREEGSVPRGWARTISNDDFSVRNRHVIVRMKRDSWALARIQLSRRSIGTLTHSYAPLRSSAPTYRAITIRHPLRSFNFNTLSISCARSTRRISFRWSTTF